MYDYVTDNVLNAMYAPNDRLGVELMGAVNWNALKKTVAKNTVNKLNQVNGGSRKKFVDSVVNAGLAVRTDSTSGIPGLKSFAAAAKKFRPSSGIPGLKNAISAGKKINPIRFLSDPLCDELWGLNDEYAVELLGSYGLSDLWRQTKKVTHKVLEAGEKVPVVDAAVARFRDITGAITGTSKAVDVAQTAYDNRGKIILIGGGAALLLYILLRKKK